MYATKLVLVVLGLADYVLFNVVGGVIDIRGFLNSSMAVAVQLFMSYSQVESDLEKVKCFFNKSTVSYAGIEKV